MTIARPAAHTTGRPSGRPSAHLAVLIDADNASAKIAERLFEEIAKLGEASVRRIYGDFSGTKLKPWADLLATYAIKAHQSFSYTTGKNAADIALVIDAMDLLHTGRFDGFCIVSSDSDFTGLASRIREQGLAVFGFGEQKTPASFRQACKRFIYTETLLLDEAPPAPQIEPATGKAPADPAKKRPRAARPLIEKALAQCDTESGWARLALVGSKLAQLDAGFDSRTYGYAKLKDLISNAGGFESRKVAKGHIEIRRKPPAKQPAQADAVTT